jgi:ferric-chelate reductase (NADPH)
VEKRWKALARGFDDHVKVFFPAPGTTFVPPVVTDDGIDWGDGVRPQTRDYTPLYDEVNQELVLDFFVHDGGIASHWAVEANVGDRLTIGGRAVRWWYRKITPGSCMCDESGMPALRRRLESMAKQPVRPEIHAVVTVGDGSYKDYLAHLSDVNITWIVGHSEQAVSDHLAVLTVPGEDYFIWLTGEGKVVKT